jgi:uncharacterized iron-regulated membrane protein
METIVVLVAVVLVFAVSLGLAYWSERQRGARLEARERRERLVATSMRNHPSVVTKGLRDAA